MWADDLGVILHSATEWWAAGDKLVKRRRVVLILGVAFALSTVLALIAFTDVL